MATQPETKSLDTLQEAKRDADNRARESIKEASAYITLANQIDETLRCLTKERQ